MGVVLIVIGAGIAAVGEALIAVIVLALIPSPDGGNPLDHDAFVSMGIFLALAGVLALLAWSVLWIGFSKLPRRVATR